MDAMEIRRKRRGEWARFGVGFVAALVNCFGAVATLFGVLAQGIRDQGDGPAAAGAFHLGYFLFNPVAMGLLLYGLGDEARDARVTVAAWVVATGAVAGAYWSWVL